MHSTALDQDFVLICASDMEFVDFLRIWNIA